MGLQLDATLNLPPTTKQRIVIIGGGFAGINLAKKLAKRDCQVVLLDRHNYHQFQPLYYQVAMSGLEPSSISFPFRKLFQGKKNVILRFCEVMDVDPLTSTIYTSIGPVQYDKLVIATGVDTNFFGNEQIRKHALPMKTVSEALALRNSILADFEYALTSTNPEEFEGLTSIVVVGGGPTGVELAGALAEMREEIVPKDYPELNQNAIRIYLLEGSDRLLQGMSDQSSTKSRSFLEKLGVQVQTNAFVTDYDGRVLTLKDGDQIRANKVIWAAGVTGKPFDGLAAQTYVRGNRLHVDRFNRVFGYDNIFALGDIAYMETESYPDGHPQVAQVAIQQAKNLARNWKREAKDRTLIPFEYKDLGSMATIGRHRAVVDLPFIKFQGILAWYTWLVVHLFQILGVKNKIFVFLNWIWNYITYDQSLRLIIGGDKRKSERKEDVVESSMK